MAMIRTSVMSPRKVNRGQIQSEPLQLPPPPPGLAAKEVEKWRREMAKLVKLQRAADEVAAKNSNKILQQRQRAEEEIQRIALAYGGLGNSDDNGTKQGLHRCRARSTPSASASCTSEGTQEVSDESRLSAQSSSPTSSSSVSSTGTGLDTKQLERNVAQTSSSKPLTTSTGPEGKDPDSMAPIASPKAHVDTLSLTATATKKALNGEVVEEHLLRPSLLSPRKEAPISPRRGIAPADARRIACMGISESSDTSSWPGWYDPNRPLTPQQTWKDRIDAARQTLRQEEQPVEDTLEIKVSSGSVMPLPKSVDEKSGTMRWPGFVSPLSSKRAHRIESDCEQPRASAPCSIGIAPAPNVSGSIANAIEIISPSPRPIGLPDGRSESPEGVQGSLNSLSTSVPLQTRTSPQDISAAKEVQEASSAAGSKESYSFSTTHVTHAAIQSKNVLSDSMKWDGFTPIWPGARPHEYPVPGGSKANELIAEKRLKADGNTTMNSVAVAVPTGSKTGDLVQFDCNGRHFQVLVPERVCAGGYFIVEMSPSTNPPSALYKTDTAPAITMPFTIMGSQLEQNHMFSGHTMQSELSDSVQSRNVVDVKERKEPAVRESTQQHTERQTLAAPSISERPLANSIVGTEKQLVAQGPLQLSLQQQNDPRPGSNGDLTYGVGIQFEYNSRAGTLCVYEISPGVDCPFLPGDRLTEVNGTSLTPNAMLAPSLLLGAYATNVHLRMIRDKNDYCVVEGMLRRGLFAEDKALLVMKGGSKACGIGVVLEVDPSSSLFFVKRVISGSPAWQAGLQQYDTILSIDGTELKGLMKDDLPGLIVGPVDSSILVTFVRQGGSATDAKQVRITRSVDTGRSQYSNSTTAVCCQLSKACIDSVATDVMANGTGCMTAFLQAIHHDVVTAIQTTHDRVHLPVQPIASDCLVISFTSAEANRDHSASDKRTVEELVGSFLEQVSSTSSSLKRTETAHNIESAHIARGVDFAPHLRSAAATVQEDKEMVLTPNGSLRSTSGQSKQDADIKTVVSGCPLSPLLEIPPGIHSGEEISPLKTGCVMTESGQKDTMAKSQKCMQGTTLRSPEEEKIPHVRQGTMELSRMEICSADLEVQNTSAGISRMQECLFAEEQDPGLGGRKLATPVLALSKTSEVVSSELMTTKNDCLGLHCLEMDSTLQVGMDDMRSQATSPWCAALVCDQSRSESVVDQAQDKADDQYHVHPEEDVAQSGAEEISSIQLREQKLADEERRHDQYVQKVKKLQLEMQRSQQQSEAVDENSTAVPRHSTGTIAVPTNITSASCHRRRPVTPHSLSQKTLPTMPVENPESSKIIGCETSSPAQENQKHLNTLLEVADAAAAAALDAAHKILHEQSEGRRKADNSDGHRKSSVAPVITDPSSMELASKSQGVKVLYRGRSAGPQVADTETQALAGPNHVDDVCKSCGEQFCCCSERLNLTFGGFLAGRVGQGAGKMSPCVNTLP